MIFTIKNDLLSAEFSSLGAELCSLKNKNGLEFIWQASPEVWPRHAPILFPIVGKLKNNTFHFENIPYSLPQHGFARDKEFEIIMQEKEALSFRLIADVDTKKTFPFDFELIVHYLLENNLLKISYEVVNPGSKPLFFSIGAHPGFCCPLAHDEKFEDYFLEFEQNEILIKHKIQEGLISDEQEEILRNNNILPLSRELFKEDALVFKSFKSNYLKIKSNSNPHQVTITLKEFPYLGIWSKPFPEAHFICIEPWYGIADPVHSNGDFSTKEGIIKLEGGASFNCTYSIEID